MEHTLLVIGAAIDRAAKATAAKNVDFMLIDLSDEVEKRGLMLLYVFKISSPRVLMDREESKKKLSSVLEMLFSQERNKKTAPSPFLLCKNYLLLAARSRTQNFLPLSGGTFVSYRSVVLALAMHTKAVTSEGIAMGRRKYGSIASVPFRHKSVSQQPMRAWPRDDLHQSCTSCVLN